MHTLRMDLLTAQVSVYNGKGKGVPFTMRSASSPLYCPANRLALRGPVPAEVKEKMLNACLWQTGTKEEDTTVTRCQQAGIPGEEGRISNLKVSRPFTHNGTGGRVISAADQGITSCGKPSLSGTNQTLPWRGGLADPEQGPRAAAAQPFSITQAGLAPTAPGLLERRGTASGDPAPACTDRVMSKVKAYDTAGGERSPVDDPTKRPGGLSHAGQGLGATWRQSLPTRLRSPSSPRTRFDFGSGFRDTANDALPGPRSGQSIWERIEKLYGSGGAGKTEDSTKTKRLSAPVGDWLHDAGGRDTETPRRNSTTDSPSTSPVNQWRVVSYQGEAGGTFPRRFSRGERTSQRTLQNNNDNNPFDCVHSGSPGPAQEPARRQMLAQEGVGTLGRGALDVDNRSPDKDRGKLNIVEFQKARATGADLTKPQQTHTILEREPLALFKDSPGWKDRLASGNGNIIPRENIKEGNTNDKVREVAGTSEQQVERLKERGLDDQMPDFGNKRMRLVDNVFENRVPKVALNNAGRKHSQEKLVIPSATNVRNKIHQFEVLTQRAQGLPIRAFSMPEQCSGFRVGIQKSGSDNAIAGLKHSWQPLREEGKAGNKTGEEWNDVARLKRSGANNTPAVIRGEKAMGDRNAQRAINLRPAVVDDIGTKQGHRDGNTVEREGNNMAAAYPPVPRNKLALLLTKGSARPGYKEFHMDETDFCKVTSPERSSADATSNDSPFQPRPCPRETTNGSSRVAEATSVHNKPPSVTVLCVSDDDVTPTNPPSNSPFLSHHPLYEFASDTAGHVKHSTPVPQHMGPTPGIQLSSSSQRSPPDLTSTVKRAPHPKDEERRDPLDAWVDGFNRKLEDCSDGDDDYDDEDTEKDEDSSYDSDSAESSVTITSNMSQSDRKSFCVSLAELCNFGGVEYESENDSSDEWSSGRRSASMSSEMSVLSCVSVLPTEELDKLLEEVRSLGDGTLQNYNDVQVAVLHKETGVGLGFSIAGGVDQSKPITVHRVFPFGIAAQEGSIREGDRVLSINGTALCGSAHWEALRILRRARTRGMGVVVLRKGDAVSPPSEGSAGEDPKRQTQTTPSADADQCVYVQLEKLSRDLGFSLEGGVGSRLGDKPLSIQKIFQGGPVGLVYPGDEVLEIQGVSMLGMRRLEAWTFIKGLPPGPVEVVLHRPLKHQHS